MENEKYIEPFRYCRLDFFGWLDALFKGSGGKQSTVENKRNLIRPVLVFRRAIKEALDETVQQRFIEKRFTERSTSIPVWLSYVHIF
jgi:hypothetical protein